MGGWENPAPTQAEDANIAQIGGATIDSNGAGTQRVSVGVGAGTLINASGQTDGISGGSTAAMAGWGWNASLFDRLRTASAANLGAQSGLGALLASSPGEWSLTNTPAANVQATVTKAASAGVRHVARSITGDFIAGTVAPAASNATLVLRDGATGVGAIIWGRYVAVSAVAGDKDDTQAGNINIPGTVGNAMTLEYTAAGGANTLQGISLTGYDAS